jgi:5-methylcytosine-specific restriction endonuclease McrA
MPAIISRVDAKAAGLKHFFTGIPCIRGHVAKWTLRGACLSCARENTANHRARDPARIERLANAPIPEETDKIVSRRDAKALGLPHYFTGIRCVNGHLSKRRTNGKECLTCHREARAIVRQTRGGAVKAQKAASYLRHQTEVIAKVKTYQTENAAAVSARTRRHRAANKVTIAAKMKVWSKANRPLLRQHEANRRAREAGSEGSHTAAEVADLLIKQDHGCAAPWCGTSLCGGYHEDHIMPLARNGTNWITNIQLLCRPCNQSKSDRDPVEWLQTEDARRAGEHIGSR